MPPLAHRLRAGATVADVLALPSIQLFLRRASLTDDDAKALGKNFIKKLKNSQGGSKEFHYALSWRRRAIALPQILMQFSSVLIRALSIQDPRLEPKDKGCKSLDQVVRAAS